MANTTVLTPQQEADIEHLAGVFARSMPGWNDDTADGELTAHWEKVNRACLKEGRRYARIAVTEGYGRTQTAHGVPSEPALAPRADGAG